MDERDEATIFERLADKVSYGMGTPANIGLWIVFVVAWIALFALHILGANTSVLPAWFTSNAFNFPLNTVTTLAELYIGFLVAAAANRNERTARRLAQAQAEMLKSVKNEDDELLDQGKSLIELTREIHEHTSLLGEIHEHVTALAPNAGEFDPK